MRRAGRSPRANKAAPCGCGGLCGEEHAQGAGARRAGERVTVIEVKTPVRVAPPVAEGQR